jgi:hypothetical protein
LIDARSFEDEQITEYWAYISDLGEGKQIRETIANRVESRFHIGDYVPPETESGQWARSSDVYSFGRIFLEVLRIRADKFHIKGGNNKVPSLLVKIIERCLGPPDTRPDIGAINRLLNDLSHDLDNNKGRVLWTEYDFFRRDYIKSDNGQVTTQEDLVFLDKTLEYVSL